MLALLRYEFNRNIRLHLIMILGFFLIIPLFTLISSFEFIPIIFLFAALLAVIIYISILFVSISTFNKSMFSKEGYFTHTLPYSEFQIILSKFLISLFWFLVCLFTLIITCSLCLGIIALKTHFSIADLLYNLDYYIRFMEMMYTNYTYTINYGNVLSSFLIVSVFKFTSIITLFYLVLSLVNTRYFNKHKKLFGLILLFVIYLLVSGCSNYIFDHVVNSVSVYSSNYTIRYDLLLNKTLIFNSISYLLQTVFYFAGSCLIISKKLEI